MRAEERLLQDRFARLGGTNDADWNDVRRRARRATRRIAVLLAAVAVGLVATGFGIGGGVIGFFSEGGKRVALSSFPPRDRELLEHSLCRRLAFSHARGKPAREVCLDGAPPVEQIARNDSEIHWRVRYPWGVTCVASGRVGGYRDPNRGDFRIGSLGCNVGAPRHKLVPTPRRPITFDESIVTSRRHPRLRLLRVSGLAGEGVASVGLVPRRGPVFKVAVQGRSYAFREIPDKPWVAIAAYDASGTEVYRRPLDMPRSLPPVSPRGARSTREQFTRPPKIPSVPPVQHAASSAASVDVYRSGVVVLRFSSTRSDPYRTLARTARHSGGGVALTCGKVAFASSGWQDIAGGSSARLAQQIRVLISTRWGGMPSPPFDFCEIAGTYGRYWNDEEGTHELVEVPFTAEGRHFLDDRGVARDLAYFERTRKMWRIRKAVHRGERAPSAIEIARMFGPRVVPLTRRDATGPAGKVGIWTDGKVIVASEPAPDGRRLFVAIRGVLIGATNIRDLAFPF